jgi:hypothetical protein
MRDSPPMSRPHPTLQSLLQWTALCALLVGAIGLWIWKLSAEQRAVVHLTAEQRRLALVETYRTLETVCAGSPKGLEDYCQKQASFLLELPECDPECRAFARDFLPRTRAR